MNGLYIYSHNSSPNSKILGEILFLYNFIFTEKFQKQF
ncbi:rCG61260, partial [Rattus norvegicus]